MVKKLTLGLVCVIVIIWILIASETPQLDRNWSVDQAVVPTALIEGDTITIKNIRNFSYQSTTEYTPAYYDRTVRLRDLTHVDYIVEPFGDIGAAHTFLSFGFIDGSQIAISVEIRKEVGESFSPWQGIANQYELTYVIADERDVVALRANHRQHDVFIYPTVATPEQAQTLFLSMLQRANAVHTTPEFYHTLFNNCTTNIARHINEISPNRIGIDYRLVLPEYSDELAKELGLIATSTSIEVARERHRINDKASEYTGEGDFSAHLRSQAPGINAAETYKVVQVLDGDTIEVEAGGKTVRVRYIGIDTPEMNYDQREGRDCYANEAKVKNEALVLDKSVQLVRDVRDKDDYGRLLRYVYTDGIFVNQELVLGGYARAIAVGKDTARYEELKASETIARNDGRGIWSSSCQ